MKKPSEKGQVVVEYIMLLAMTFVTAYIMVTGPMSAFTRGMIGRIRVILSNVTQNGELAPGPALNPGQNGHPGDPARHRALH